MPVLAACVAGSLPAASARGVVTVTVEPPSVKRVEFDRRRPPPDMPAAQADGGAVCSNVFEIEATIESAIDVLAPTTVLAHPENFELITRLKVTLYVPTDAPQKLRAHEEGHRAIGEHYYASAEAAAREAATALVGQSFQGNGADRAAAELAAGELVLAALKDGFMRRTHARSAAANARYDTITEHGRSAIAEPEAIAKALADDP